MNNGRNIRLDSFDFVKGLLIIMVVWGHICAHCSGIDYEKNVLTSYIRLFQMPMFIVISGYFQKTITSRSDLYGRIKKTIVHIGLPLLVWSIIASFVLYILKLIGITWFSNSTGVFGIAKALFKSFRFYWFLPCLMLCIFLNSFLSLLSNMMKIKIGLMYLLSSIMLLFVPSYMFHFQFMWPFFILGNLFRNYSHKEFFVSFLHGNAPQKIDIVLTVILGGGTFV